MGGAQSVHRAVAILREIASRGARGARLKEVVDGVGLNKTTTRRLLAAMCRERLLEQDPETRLYRLGLESYVFGVVASERFGIRQAATGCVLRLARASHDTVFLSVPSGTYSFCLHREEGGFPIRTQALNAGQRYPLGLGAGSLALLAAMPDREIERIIRVNEAVVAESFPCYSSVILRRLVDETRAAGFAVNPGMIVAGSWAVGVAVPDEHGYPLAALSIAAIASRMENGRREELAGLLLDEAKTLSETLIELHRVPKSGEPDQPPRSPARGAQTRRL